MHRWVGGLVVVLVLGVLAAAGPAGCRKKATEPVVAQSPDAIPEPGVPDAAGQAGPGEVEPPTNAPLEAGFVRVQPQAVPAGMPSWATAVDIPEDAYDVDVKVPGILPVRINLKADAVIGGIPCGSGILHLTEFHEGGRLAFCYLAFDFVVQGFELQKETRIRLRPNGELEGFLVPESQLVHGIPMERVEEIEVSPPPDVEPISFILGSNYSIGSVEYLKGAGITREPGPGHAIRSVLLAQAQDVKGKSYPGGSLLFFDAQGEVTGAAGVFAPPGSPATCPEQSSVELEATRADYPEGIDWSAVRAVTARHFEYPMTDSVWVEIRLSNYDAPPPPEMGPVVGIPPDSNASPEELARMVTLVLGVSRTDGRELVPGIYRFAPPFGERLLGPSGHNYAATAVLERPSDDGFEFEPASTEGEIEVTVIDDEHICGSFRFQGSGLRIQGSFSAPVIQRWVPVM